MKSPSGNSINAFLTALRQSGLIEPSQLDSVLAEFSAPNGQPYGDSLTSLISLLIAGRQLTDWQARKLRQDKYKGFVQDEFVLLDELETVATAGFQRYLARDSRRNRLVTLMVFPPGDRPRASSFYELEGDFA